MVTQLGAMPVSSTNPSPGALPSGAITSSPSPAAGALAHGEQGQPQTRRSAAENRRSNKPIMEKKRRARINNCLNELKTLILDAMKKDPARHSKLEKADILEMTVKHFETLQRQQNAMAAAADPNIINKFRAGFSECASEVGRFPGLDAAIRRRLLQHLATCLNGHSSATATPTSTTPSTTTTTPQLQMQILPASDPAPQPNPVITAAPTTGFFLSNGGVPLVPTRLPNGDLALVLPSSYRAPAASPAPSSAGSSSSSSSASSPVPMLVPIPNRTPSASPPVAVALERLQVQSTSPKPSTPSPVPVAPPTPITSPPVIDERAYTYSPPLQKPLSLVMRKTVCQPEEKPWRPW